MTVVALRAARIAGHQRCPGEQFEWTGTPAGLERVIALGLVKVRVA